MRKRKSELPGSENVNVVPFVVHQKIRTFESHLNMGRHFFESGRVAEALKEWQKALRLNRDNTELLLEMGVAYAENEQIMEARKCFKKVLLIDPRCNDAYFYLGLAECFSGELEQGIKIWKKGLELFKDDWEMRMLLAEVYVEIDKPVKALSEVERVLKEFPDDIEALNLKGIIMLSREDYTQAVKILRHCVNAEPLNARCHMNLGIAYIYGGMLDSAIMEFRRAYRISPQYVESGVNLAHALLHRGEYTEAENVLGTVLECDRENLDAMLLLANIYLETERPNEAKPLIDQLLKDDPEDADALAALGLFLAGRGEFSSARKSFQAALKSDPTFPAFIYKSLAGISLAQGKNERALRELSAGIREDPDFADLYLMAGDIHQLLGNHSQAVQNWNKALELSPHDESIRARLFLS